VQRGCWPAATLRSSSCASALAAPAVSWGTTAQQLRIFQRLLGLQPQGIISGAGGQQARLRSVDDVVTLRMTWVELQGMRFESVRALVHTHGDPPDLELGAYAAGLLASDLFRDCTLVLDYPARRFAAVPFADKD